jgi:hypothetical protein
LNVVSGHTHQLGELALGKAAALAPLLEAREA